MPCPAPLSLDASETSPQPRRLGTDIPGYTGYVPRKEPDILVGKSFRKANDLASVSASIGRSGPSGGSGGTPIRRSLSPQARDLLCSKPTGAWVSTDEKAPFFSYGKRQDRGVIGPDVVARDGANWAANLRAGGDGLNLQMEWRYMRSPSYERTFSPKKSRRKSRSVSPERAIPGYQGYIPRVTSDNIYGGTYKAVTEKAASRDADGGWNNENENGSSRIRCSGSRSVSRGRTTQSPERQAVGYGGYIPGVKCENIYGLSYKTANEKATATALSQDGAVAVVKNFDASERVDRPEDLAATKSKWGLARGKPKAEATAEPFRKASDADLQSRLVALVPVEPPSNINPEDALWRRCNSASKERSSQGRDIPGYSGYVPQKRSGNVYGESYYKANRSAARIPVVGESDRDPRAESPQWTRSLSPRAAISGYQGYVPKANAKIIYGSGHRSTRERAAVEANERRPSNEAEINAEWSQSLRGGVRRKRSECESFSGSGSACGESCSGEPGSLLHGPGAHDIPPASPQSKSRSYGAPASPQSRSKGAEANSPAGRSYGLSYSFGAPASPSPSRCRTPQRDRNGDGGGADGESRNFSQMPGYAGYVPKKGPENVMGTTFAKANQRAFSGIDPVAGATTESSFLQSDPFVATA